MWWKQCKIRESLATLRANMRSKFKGTKNDFLRISLWKVDLFTSNQNHPRPILHIIQWKRIGLIFVCYIDFVHSECNVIERWCFMRRWLLMVNWDQKVKSLEWKCWSCFFVHISVKSGSTFIKSTPKWPLAHFAHIAEYILPAQMRNVICFFWLKIVFCKMVQKFSATLEFRLSHQ